MAANKEALDQGTAIREKQLTEFNAEEKDFLESAIALKAVIHQAILTELAAKTKRSTLIFAFEFSDGSSCK